MPIGSIRTREVVVARRDTTAAQAARMMREFHVGDVIVVDEIDGRQVPCGVVTDRDIVVTLVAQQVDPDTVKLSEMMSENPTVARDSDDVADAIQMMRTKGVRRLPIVDAKGALVGIVTVDDLLALLTDEMTSLTTMVAREQRREVIQRR